jgi:hypothetical protein
MRLSPSFNNSFTSSILTSFLLGIYTRQGYLKTTIYAMGCTDKRERMKKYESLSENRAKIKNLFPWGTRGKDQILTDGNNISNY